MKIIRISGNTQLTNSTFDALIFVDQLVHVNREGQTLFLFYRGDNVAMTIKYRDEAEARKLFEEILSFVDEVK